MTENLIAGYLAYTTAEEFGASAAGSAPATTPTLFTTSTNVTVTSTVPPIITATENC